MKLNEDELYEETTEYTILLGKITASLLKIKYKIGYNRANRILEQLEENNIIGPYNGSKPREVLINNINNN